MRRPRVESRCWCWSGPRKSCRRCPLVCQSDRVCPAASGRCPARGLVEARSCRGTRHSPMCSIQCLRANKASRPGTSASFALLRPTTSGALAPTAGSRRGSGTSHGDVCLDTSLLVDQGGCCSKSQELRQVFHSRPTGRARMISLRGAVWTKRTSRTGPVHE